MIECAPDKVFIENQSDFPTVNPLVGSQNSSEAAINTKEMEI